VTHLIYTPAAIVIAQLIIAAPLMIGLTVHRTATNESNLQLQLLG